MKGLYLNGTGDLDYTTVDDPVIEDPHDMIVRVTACAICGSDLHYLHGVIPVSDLCLGHEAIGEVMEVGRAVERRRAGDMVLLTSTVGCGECRFCRSGAVNRCEKGFRSYGGGGLQGCQADAVRVPRADFNSIIIPASLSHDQALMLTDALPTAFHACVNAAITPGSTVAILGMGAIGLMAVEVAAVMGAALIFAIDPIAGRRAQAAGAIGLDPAAAVEVIREKTGGRGVDAVIEVVGLDETILAAFDLVAAGGIISVVGANVNPAFPFPMGRALFHSVTFRISASPVICYWPQMISLIEQGRLTPEKYITHKFPLSEGVEAYRMFDAKSDSVIKTILLP